MRSRRELWKQIMERNTQGSRSHSSCLQGKMLHFRIVAVRGVFAFHQSCLHLHDLAWSCLSISGYQTQLLQKHLLLKVFLADCHPCPVFQFIWFFPPTFLHFFSFFFDVPFTAYFVFLIYTFLPYAYFAVPVIPTTNVCCLLSPYFLLPFTCIFLSLLLWWK